MKISQRTGRVQRPGEQKGSVGPAHRERGTGGTAPYQVPEAHSYTSCFTDTDRSRRAPKCSRSGEDGGPGQAPRCSGLVVKPNESLRLCFKKKSVVGVKLQWSR